MSSEAFAIRVRSLSKSYQIYDQPRDRLRQSLYPRLQRLAGLMERQYYTPFWALRDVSFDVRRGETVGIVGKNGSGKSTLLHLIVGTHASTSGTIEVNGRVTALLELGSGFNPQFTGRENVFLNAAIHGLTREQTGQRFDEIAAFADIGAFIDRPVSTYSSGMYMRLAFAVQVCLDPDILVIDEALAVGDAYFVHRCFHRIRAMKEQGKTILLVSHDTASVNNLCDRAIWLGEGRVRLEGAPDEVTARYRADLFGITLAASSDGLAREVEAAAQGVRPARVRDAEMVIPNIDLRMGKHRARILGAALYDPKSLTSVGVTNAAEELVLRVTFTNEALEPGTRMIFGYMICTPRGEEIGGLNTRMAEFPVEAPERGASSTVKASIRLPDLHPAHYAFTIAIASEDPAGVIEIEDRVENAIVFQVANDREVVGWMRLPTSFALE